MSLNNETIQSETVQQVSQLATQDMPKTAFGMSFAPVQPKQQSMGFSCGGLIPVTSTPTTTPTITRHPETGQPIQTPAFAFGLSTNNINNNRCFPVPQNIVDDKQDKKKILDTLYSELTIIRSEIDKLNKSVDTIYSIIRHL